MKLAHFLVLLNVFVLLSGESSHAYGSYGREDQSMVANGQGVSSPSFWEGLKGQNPAGLSFNQRLKFQASAAAFGSDLDPIRASGGVLFGSSFLGGGVEFSQFDSGPYASGIGAIQWGLGGNLDVLNLRLGVSGRHIKNTAGSYTVGLLFEPVRAIRVGLMVPRAQNGIGVVGAGLTFMLDPAIDVVVDGSLEPSSSHGVVKPGLTFHSHGFQLSASYGFRVRGTTDPLLYARFSGALGLKLSDHIFLEYSYRGLPEHLLGLTLR
jgi:hypothetical protein